MSHDQASALSTASRIQIERFRAVVEPSNLPQDLSATLAVSTAGGLGLQSSLATPASGTATQKSEDFRWAEATMAELQAAMESGQTTALALTRDYLARIVAMDWDGPRVNSIIETNPDAERSLEASTVSDHRARSEGPCTGYRSS